MKNHHLGLSLALALALSAACNGKTAPEQIAPPDPATEAAMFASGVNSRLLDLWRAQETAQWEHQTDLTAEKEAAAAKADEAVMEYLSQAIPQAAQYDGITSLDPMNQRMLGLLKTSSMLPAPADPAKRAELAQIASKMSSMYGKGEWCPTDEEGAAAGECLQIGAIEERLAESRDAAEQLELWRGWHSIAPPMRNDYQRFVELANQGATEIGFSDLGQLWRSGYDMPPDQVEAMVDRLWGQLRPMYEALHCDVRAGLVEQYGAEVVPPEGPIPAHLTGNLWAQDWTALYPLVEPHPGKASLDVTKALEEKGWDAQKMTKAAEGFFVSMGLDPLPATFWERSMFVKPEGRDVVCHASAWDPTWSDDLRIKMCIRPTQDDLVTLHHELGHLYYYHYYKDLPTLFRNGANDGFHEAIGDTIALSITPTYMSEIGLLEAGEASPEATVNAQMAVALQRVAFLPFGLLVDKWRWEVFDGRIAPDAYNAGWWRLRNELQGVAPAEERGEEHFDPGAKYHVPANTPYLRYFLAHVLEFQLHRALCDEAGFEGPLHECSVYGNEAAGEKLKTLLSMGASKPWPDALEAATGQREIDASAMVEYFQPLMTYLEAQNADRTCGW
jgi:peptidyl-dipeptidase A